MRAAVDDPATLFPLRFTAPDTVEVINGALSGCFGYRLVFQSDPAGLRVLLVDGLGATAYRRRP